MPGELIIEPHVNLDPVGGGQGFFLSDQRVRRIVSGSVNLFVGCFDKATGESQGNYHFVAGLEAGDLLFPVAVELDSGDVCHRLLAIPLAETEIGQSEASWVDLLPRDETLRDGFEQFMRNLLHPFALAMPPAKTRVITRADLNKGPSFQFVKGASFRPSQGILWIGLEDGFCILNGDEAQMLLAPESAFPLSPRMWFECQDEVTIVCRTTSQLLLEPHLDGVMTAIYRQYLRAVLVAVAYRRQRRLDRQKRLVAYERAAIKGIVQQLRQLIFHRQSAADRPLVSASPCPMHAVIERVARACGVDVTIPESAAEADLICNIPNMTRQLETCQLYYRIVRLNEGWWREEGIPAIALRGQGQTPVALFYARGRWMLFDPVRNEEIKVTPAVAAELAPEAISVYVPLPSRPLLAKDVLSVAFQALRADYLNVFSIGMIGGLIALAPVWLTSTIFNTVIPSADIFQLFQAGVILLSAAVSAALLELSRSILMLRIKTRSSFQLQAAVWGRMLNLPSRFFSKYTAGDLANRVMGVDAIRNQLADNVSTACMALVFATPNVALMIFYSTAMTVVGVLALLIYAALLGWLGYRNYQNQQEQYKFEGELAGFGLQVLSGIAKIRMSISENRAFIRWAAVFGEKIRWESRSIVNMNVLAVLNALFAPLMTGLFFLIIGTQWLGTDLNVGDYLAFNGAFTVLVMAFAGFAGIIPALLSSLALYERLKPVLRAMPEVIESQKAAGEIDGNVEIRNVTFRYSPDLPPVLDNVSITATSGELIAIVGPSGAGKSTIARLLLGFDAPESGGIFYGGIDLASVNLRDLRKQIGVVLQGGGLIIGSIYDNIAGGAGMTMDTARQAARLAGLDQDIEAMPMGMHTLMFPGAVSGGQQQRILIARALARNPKLIIFDEATSALDNETQAHVSDSLERLNATRIVIAHRLSTIINADRIYVLQAGCVVQVGTFAELISQPGLFQELAKRQML